MCPWDDMLFFVVLALMCFFYNRSLKKHIILLWKCTSRLANKRIHIKLVSSATCFSGVGQNTPDYALDATHHAIMRSRVNAVVIATTNWAAILWVLWRHTDGLYIKRRWPSVSKHPLRVHSQRHIHSLDLDCSSNIFICGNTFRHPMSVLSRLRHFYSVHIRSVPPESPSQGSWQWLSAIGELMRSLNWSKMRTEIGIFSQQTHHNRGHRKIKSSSLKGMCAPTRNFITCDPWGLLFFPLLPTSQ